MVPNSVNVLFNCVPEKSNATFSKVLLVDVTSARTGKSARVYAVIDEQSTKSFITPSLVDKLGVTGGAIDYSITTLQGLGSSTGGLVVTDLVVKGVNESESYKLPPVVTNQFIPNCVGEVATPELVKACPRVSHYGHLFAPFDSGAEVSILIGRDSEDIMGTRCLTNVRPWVHKTVLGYALVGSLGERSGSSEALTLKTSIEHFSFRPDLTGCEEMPVPEPEELDTLSTCGDYELSARSICKAPLDATMRHGTNVDAEGNITMPSPLWVPEELMSYNNRSMYARTKNSSINTAGDPDRPSKCADTRGRCIGVYGSGANCTQSDPIEITNDVSLDEDDDDLNKYVVFARRSLQRMKVTMVSMKKPPYQMRFFR